MRIALNLSTLGDLPLPEALAQAARAGFKLVELRAPSLKGDVAGLLRQHGLEAVSINALERVGERDLREEARRLAALAAGLGCPYLLAVPGRPRRGLPEALEELRGICRAEGVELAFEFLGFPWAAVRTLKTALGVFDGPLVVDTFHWALGDGSLDDLRALDLSRLALVHVNDAPPGPLERLGDQDRVLPGEGVLELEGFYGVLRDLGYGGVYSVELFKPVGAERAYWAMTRLVGSEA